MRFGFPAAFCASLSLVGADVAPGSSPAAAPKLTLRAKGTLAFVLLMLYIAIVAVFVGQQWHKSLVLHEQLEQLNIREKKVELLEGALAHALLEAQARAFSADPAAASKDLLLDIELIRRNAENLTQYYPNLVPIHERLGRSLAELLSAPTRERFGTLRQSMNVMGAQINKISEEVHDARENVMNASRQLSESIALIAVTMGLLGATVFGAVVTLFFNRLASDVKKLEARALDVVTGYRGAPLDVTRHDEVGGLMEVVNRMQSELRHREQQLEISRQQRFHQEKMAAVGSLAAAVAHEINNPIAAITGIAQSMSDTKQTQNCPQALCQPELILEQTKRIAWITHQVAELTALHSPEPELLDLNALVKNTCDFVSYDQRFRDIDLVFGLDHDLPAINAVVDHLTQVLMNLLINAADALEGVKGRKPFIRVATGAADGEVLMTVSDNGCGMDRAVLSQAFNDSFTTKPLGKGSGLGLFLCKTLIEGCGGRIELESTPDVGTTAQVRLPLPQRQRVAS
jgi:two-component system, NtrC family, sensor kinase